MPNHNSTATQVVPIRNGTVVLSGFGLRISVDRRHLTVEDGIGRQRRRGRFAKAPSRLRRLVVISRTGFVSFEAIRWLHDAGAALVHLDADGTLLATSAAGLDDARLRRAQVIAAMGDQRLTLAREMLQSKLRGQLATINSFGLANGALVTQSLSDLERAETLEAAILAEAQAAEAYWGAWTEVRMSFALRDLVPDHWRGFASRRSPLTHQPRNAADPINALLNYTYMLLESETRIALIARGLDPGLGFFHADFANRDSFAADIMEPVRPHVDAFVLDLLRKKTFSARDFAEQRDGGCRLSPTLAQELAATLSTWRAAVAPYVDRAFRVIQTAPRKAHIPTAFRAATIAVRSKPETPTKPLRPSKLAAIPSMTVSNACRACGAKIGIRKRLFCNACLTQRRKEVLAQTAPAFSAKGRAKLAELRARGMDPSQSPVAAKLRAATAMKQRRAAVTWKDDGSLDEVDFNRDILPGIQAISTRALGEALGMSSVYCSKIRNGLLIPHRRHWKTLLEISSADRG